VFTKSVNLVVARKSSDNEEQINRTPSAVNLEIKSNQEQRFKTKSKMLLYEEKDG